MQTTMKPALSVKHMKTMLKETSASRRQRKNIPGTLKSVNSKIATKPRKLKWPLNLKLAESWTLLHSKKHAWRKLKHF
jgi:hypothetical protein